MSGPCGADPEPRPSWPLRGPSPLPSTPGMGRRASRRNRLGRAGHGGIGGTAGAEIAGVVTGPIDATEWAEQALTK